MGKGLFGFSVLNRAFVIRKIHDAGQHENGRFGRAVKATGDEIMQISQNVYVPVDTGDLQATGRVDDVKQIRGSGVFIVEMKYGGDMLPYAVNVHETNRNYRNGRQWKYLETPAKQFNYTARVPSLYRKLGGASIEGPS